MTEIPVQPSIYSLEFHTKFFPQLLWVKIRPKTKQEALNSPTRFSHTLDFMLLLTFCLILTAIGIPLALKHGSVVGWIMGIPGIVGILAILIFSVLSQLDTKPSFANFLIGLFFFFTFLGFSAGAYVGMTQHTTKIYMGTTIYSLPWVLSSIFLGLFLGYVSGLFAGLWFQCLGWIAQILDMMAGCAIIGIVIVDLVLLSGK